MTPEQITIPTTRTDIYADWYEGAQRDTLLTLTGFGGRKERYQPLVANIVGKTGLSALVVDLSGHGQSPIDIDDTTPSQHVIEALQAYDYLATDQERSMHVMGTSYGGFIAAHLSQLRVVEKLILRTPALYRPEHFDTPHRHIDKIAVRRYRADWQHIQSNPVFVRGAATLPETTVIIHSHDEDIPPETTEAYRQAFEATTYTAYGFSHAFGDPANHPPHQVAAYHQAIYDALA
jgi:uncharacterized protein